MKNFIKSLLLKLTPQKAANLIFRNHPAYKQLQFGHTSFSQEGEDMILRIIFETKPVGTYVDIGAHHPVIFSNTNFFFQKGWSGINLDALPGSKVLFDVERPADINLELVVSENEGPVEFYLFDPSLVNTMSKVQAEENLKNSSYKLLETVLLPSMPLSGLLDKYLAPGKKIDFMSIDVEGAEMGVLRSNNWEKYSPDVLLVEILNVNVDDVFTTEVHRFLTALSYQFFAKTGNTLFYKKKGFEF